MFLPMQSPATITILAEKQLDGYYYMYPISNTVRNKVFLGCMLTFHQARASGIPWRLKPYWNDRILTVLCDIYFSGGTSSYARGFDAMFPSNEGPDGVKVCRMPEAMLGLVATGVSVSYQLRHYTNL